MRNFPLHLITFPVWWYTVGLGLAWQSVRRHFWFGVHRSGITLFARHMGEPLYGDYTRAGRVISFFLRIFLLVFKFLALCLRTLVLAVFGLGYLLIIPFILYMIVFQLFL